MISKINSNVRKKPNKKLKIAENVLESIKTTETGTNICQGGFIPLALSAAHQMPSHIKKMMSLDTAFHAVSQHQQTLTLNQQFIIKKTTICTQ